MEYIVPKVALILAGGTTLDFNDIKGSTVSKKGDIKQWLTAITDYRIVANVEPFFVYGGDDVEMPIARLEKIAKIILANYKDYVGFVVTCNFPVITYTATALAFLLSSIGKPVVVTGTPLSAYDPELNERLEKLFRDFSSLGVKVNIVNALQAAVAPFSEVSIVYGNWVIRPTQAKPHLLSSLDLVDTMIDGEIGRVDFGVRFKLKTKPRHKLRSKPKIKLDRSVQYIDLSYNFNLTDFKKLIKNKHGLVLYANSGLVSYEKQRLLEKLAKRIPVVLYCPSEYLYKTMPNIIYVSNMTQTAVVTKLMWALGQTRDVKKIRAIIKEEMVFEFLSPSTFDTKRSKVEGEKSTKKS